MPRCRRLAAPLAGSKIKLTNSAWSFTAESLASAASLDDILLLNDFEALALLLLGPGTGIGVAGLVWSGADWIAVPSEGGHISLAAHSRHEFEIIERLRGSHDHLSAERVLSGPGLANLYRAIADSHGVAAPPLQPNEVLTRGGVAGSDPLAVEALALFVTWLGAFAGDVALAFCARGGVYLGGGNRGENRDCPVARRLPSGLRGEGPHAEPARSHSSLCNPCRICHAAWGGGRFACERA